jgi:hexosaminidase
LSSSYGYQLNRTSSTESVSDIISTAIKRARETIFDHGYTPWKFHPRNSAFEPTEENSKWIKQITLQQTGQDPIDILKPAEGSVDESYELEVTVSGEVTISASTSIGIAHGLTSFSQLFFQHTDGGVYTPFAPVSIKDSPMFVHRGLNLDIARSWYPLHHIKRTIDAMAYTKMNRLHLHITDAQSWPLEIPSMPELSAKGAYNKLLTYSPEDLDDLQLYGAVRGVDVYLEIDMPGHTSSLWYSHPELIASFNIQPNWGSVAAEPPSGTLKLNSSAVTTFVTDLFKDLLPRVGKYNTYFHTGGDEVNANAYTNDDTVRSSDPTVITPLMQKFLDHAHDVVRSAGMTPIVWEEMLIQWGLTLGKDVIVQTWQSDEAAATTVAKGHKVLVGNYNYWVCILSS